MAEAILLATADVAILLEILEVPERQAVQAEATLQVVPAVTHPVADILPEAAAPVQADLLPEGSYRFSVN